MYECDIHFTFMNTIFLLHDRVSNILVRNMVLLKRTLLFFAFFSLLGIFVPEWRKDFGEQALNVLLFLLFLSPISKILGMRLLVLLMSYRRQLGILMGALAIVHGSGYLFDLFQLNPNTGAWGFVSSWFVDSAFALGVCALLLTVPLLLTSNDFSTKWLGIYWKRVQFLAYPLLFFAVFHKFATEHGAGVQRAIPPTFFVLGIYLLLKFWAYRGMPSILVSVRDQISSRYRSFLASRSSVTHVSH